MRWNIISRLVRDNNFKCGAEVGVAYGRNLFNVLDRCPELNMVAVDIWQPVKDVSDKGPKGLFGYPLVPHKTNEETVRKRAKGYGNRLVIMKMDSVKAASTFKDGSFDFVFIDACHAKEEAKRDIEAWRPKVKEGGIVMGHDIHFPTVEEAVVEVFGEYTKYPDNVWCYYA